jgi:hypothetical protein
VEARRLPEVSPVLGSWAAHTTCLSHRLSADFVTRV